MAEDPPGRRKGRRQERESERRPVVARQALFGDDDPREERKPHQAGRRRTEREPRDRKVRGGERGDYAREETPVLLRDARRRDLGEEKSTAPAPVMRLQQRSDQSRSAPSSQGAADPTAYGQPRPLGSPPTSVIRAHMAPVLLG